LSGIMKKINVMKMKKVILSILVGSTMVLASCGGSTYTTDKDEALEMKKEMTADLPDYYADLLAIHTEYKESEKEILADYGGKTETLMEKAKTKDEAALTALADLRDLQSSATQDEKDLERAKDDKERALNQSIRDIRYLNDAKDLTDWNKALQAENKIASTLAEASDKAIGELYKDDK